MAYDLFPNITVTSGTGDAVPVATTLAHEMHEITGITFNWSGDMLSAWLGVDSAIRWTSYVEDIAKFSALYPDLRISAEFEDMNGDRWIVYALAGETQSEDGKVVFGDCKLWGDPPDVAAWHPILAAPLSEADKEAIKAEGPGPVIPLDTANWLDAMAAEGKKLGGASILGFDNSLPVPAPGSAEDDSDEGTSIFVSERELATILAALRWWQRTQDQWISSEIASIAETGGARLSHAEIDTLCEEINVYDPEWQKAARCDRWSERQSAEMLANTAMPAKINMIGGAK